MSDDNILDNFEKDSLQKMEDYDNEILNEQLAKAGTYEEKAEILLNEKVYSYYPWLLFFIIVIVIAGNIYLHPPMISHSNGHFAFIFHPIKTLKECYFGWGIQENSFIYSIEGLKHYLASIPYIYKKFGFIRATFAYFTQLSPLWAFLPAHLLIRGISSLIRDIVYFDKEALIEYLKEKEENK